MLTRFFTVALVALLAACDGPADKPANMATDSTLVAPGTDSVVYDEVLPGAVKADSYFGRMALEDLSGKLTAFVPAGYQVMDTCSGDLNLDSIPDWLLVLNRPGEDTLGNGLGDTSIKRKLLVLTGQPDQTYKLAAESDNAIYCSQCGGAMGDPYQGLVIKKGYFSIEYYGGAARRWTRTTTTFKYVPADTTWFLHKDGHGEFDAAPDEGKGENKTEKIYTVKDFGRLPFSDFDIYKD